MEGVVEIITGRERRRRLSQQDKVRIVAETNEPGSMIRAVAARHGVCESLLFTWRRQAREGLLGPAPERPVFVPVQAFASVSTAVAPLDKRPRPAPALRSAGATSLIEIELGNGRQVRLGSDVNLAALRTSCPSLISSRAQWCDEPQASMKTRHGGSLAKNGSSCERRKAFRTVTVPAA